MTEGGARSDVERRVLDALEALGVPYRVMDVDPALADTADFCAHYGIAPEASGNTIIVASRTEPRRYCACIVTAETRLDVNKTVRRLLGVRKASFASPEETSALTGMMIGGVTPFGLPVDLPLYIDPRVMQLDEVWVGGGSRSIKLGVSPEALTQLPNAEVIEGLGVELS